MTQTCTTCAWRGGCNKKFSIADPSRCVDYARDVSLPATTTAPEGSVKVNAEKSEKTEDKMK
ncbi:hypothetical protein [Chrysiogenes arsenatis]|uniref:hypothetical protein n=1 Tax=Chrysiogenes arsenatis TaxID=309797 RepID=UPI000420622A|nr:hypothetical protein [Chrysiogenes arsenatis]